MLQTQETKNNNSLYILKLQHVIHILDFCLTGPQTFHAQYGLVTDWTLLKLPEVVHLAQDRVHYRKFIHRVICSSWSMVNSTIESKTAKTSFRETFTDCYRVNSFHRQNALIGFQPTLSNH